MKIAILNKWDIEGGAAKAAYRLVNALKKQNHQVHYFTNVISLNDKKNIHKLKFDKEAYRNKVDELIQKNYINSNRSCISNTLFTFTFQGINLENQKLITDCDIINLHWVEKLISNSELKELINTGIPLVWTLHDMKPFTGGCHYSSGCREFEKECLNCIQLKNDIHHLPNKVLKEKKEILEKADITIVTPSKWLAEEAKKSSIFRKKRIEVIPNAIDIEIYKPIDKKIAKKLLNIPSGKIVLQFGAHNANEKRKGFEFLLKAIDYSLKEKTFKQLCDMRKIVLLVMGHSTEEVKSLPIETIELGFLKNEKDVVLAYNATDLFILPTLEDNFPNTMLEAFACQTPIIAFDTGGVSDLISHGENGLLVDLYDEKALGKAIIKLVMNEDMRKKFGINARKLIENNYTLDIQANAYLELFNDLLSNGTKNPETCNIHLDKHLYDDIVGYAFMKELQENRYAEKNLLSAYASKRPSCCEQLTAIKADLNKLCMTSTIKAPVKKIKAYKNLINSYKKLK